MRWHGTNRLISPQKAWNITGKGVEFHIWKWQTQADRVHKKTKENVTSLWSWRNFTACLQTVVLNIPVPPSTCRWQHLSLKLFSKPSWWGREMGGTRLFFSFHWLLIIPRMLIEQWSTSETTVVEKTLEVWEMVQRVKVFLARLDNLSSRPKTHKVEVKIWIHKLSSDLYPLPQYRKKRVFKDT